MQRYNKPGGVSVAIIPKLTFGILGSRDNNLILHTYKKKLLPRLYTATLADRTTSQIYRFIFKEGVIFLKTFYK